MVKLTDNIDAFTYNEFTKKFEEQLNNDDYIGLITELNDNKDSLFLSLNNYGSLSDEELKEVEEKYKNKLHIYLNARYKEIFDMLSEARDRLWLVNLSVKDSTLQENKEKINDIINKYNIDVDNCDEFYIGYWNGILNSCYYILGYGLTNSYRNF